MQQLVHPTPPLQLCLLSQLEHRQRSSPCRRWTCRISRNLVGDSRAAVGQRHHLGQSRHLRCASQPICTIATDPQQFFVSRSTGTSRNSCSSAPAPPPARARWVCAQAGCAGVRSPRVPRRGWVASGDSLRGLRCTGTTSSAAHPRGGRSRLWSEGDGVLSRELGSSQTSESQARSESPCTLQWRTGGRCAAGWVPRRWSELDGWSGRCVP